MWNILLLLLFILYDWVMSNNQRHTGWLGIPLAIGVFAIQVYTAILLGKCWIIAEEIEPNIVKKNRWVIISKLHKIVLIE